MQLPVPLHRAILHRRYKRFLADVELEDGTELTAHIADPGRLPGLAVPGAEIWLSKSDDEKRKLPWRIELFETATGLVGANTANANRLAMEALEAGSLPSFTDWRIESREPRLEAGTRLDFALENAAGAPAFLEVKNITWRRDDVAAFPDAVTARGRKHLMALSALAQAGTRAFLLFICQRADVAEVHVAEDIDPAYAAAFEAARQAGVEMRACRCDINFDAINITAEIAIG